MSPWLSVIGLGEDGLDGLTPAARAALAQAALIVGGSRHLALIGAGGAERLAWPSPLQDAFPRILAMRGEPVCVLASGDPFFYGVGSLLAEIVPSSQMRSWPQPSAFSLAAARLGWALQDCALVTLHGRAIERIVPHLQPGARVLALSWDGETPARVAALLCARGLGGAAITVCEAMGGARERLRAAKAEGFDLGGIDPLNTLAIEIPGIVGDRIAPRAPGLPDDWFDNDGQLTKCEMRALTLCALAPRPRERLWDVGAGSGAIAIEWLLADASTQATAIERDPARCARLAGNAAALGVSRLDALLGVAPEALAGLPTPDAVFIGGGFTRAGAFDACWAALRPGGRLVVNAVTIEAQADAAGLYARHGGRLIQAQFARAASIGRFHSFRPALPVTQWRAVKP